MRIQFIFRNFVPKLDYSIVLYMRVKKIYLLLFVLAAMFCGSNTYAQSNVEEITLTISNKEVQGSGRYANLVLTGIHETYGNVAIYLNEYNGSYKTYEIYYATVGEYTLTGKGTWSRDGFVEKLDATLSTADFDKEPTEDDQIFHIIATYTEDAIISLNFSGFSTFGYDANYNDWFMRIEGTDPTKPEYGYKVELAYYAPANNGYGTFTSADNQINMADSYIHTPTGDVLFDSVTLTVERIKVSDNLVQTIANARLCGRNGVVYLVNCVHNSITPKEQHQVCLDCASLTRNEHSFSFDADCNDYDVSLVVNSDVLIGKFPMKSIDMSQSYFRCNDDKLKVLSIQAETTAQTIANELACVAQIALLTQDTVQYVFLLTYLFPTPTEYVELVATNLVVNDVLAEELKYVSFDAKTEQYIISGMLAGTEIKAGRYTQDELSVSLRNIQTNQTIHSLDANLDVNRDDYARWAITGTMRGDDNVVYNLDLTYVVPTPKDTVVVRFNTSSKATFTPDMDNDLLFENENENYYASVNVRGIEMGSTFSILDVDREFCGVKDSITGVSTELADIYGTIFQVGDTTIMQAELIDMGATLYDIELWYVVPTPKDTVTLSFPVTFGDQRSEEGFYQLYGPSQDTSYIVAFSPLSDEIVGTFVNDGLFGKFGAEGGQMQMDYRNTYIAKMDGNMVTAIMPLEKGQMTVEMDREGNITAVAEAICADSVYYHITMTSKYDREYLKGDKQTGAVDKQYTSYDFLQTIDYSSDGYVYLTITSSDQSELTAMHIFVDSTDADILIPEGVYPINKSYRPGTVLANVGPDEENRLATPFFATISEQGYLEDVYMWVKGTVEVVKKEGKLYLEVNAVNSYDVPVHIIYDGAAETGINNVLTPENDSYKSIKNGQLIIRKDGVEYNAQGARF